MSDVLYEVQAGAHRSGVGLFCEAEAHTNARRVSMDPAVQSAVVTQAGKDVAVYVSGVVVRPEDLFAAGAKIKTERVKSSNIESYGAVTFSRVSKGVMRRITVAEVRFTSGSVYRYADCGLGHMAIREAITEQSSVGKAFARHLRLHPRHLTARRNDRGGFDPLG